MKKNISINLFGTLYQIDEDAYNLLERYLDSMKSYFSRQEGGEEIADDIEHRVAELLWTEKENGKEAVNIDMIKAIMEKIGNPADIDTANAATPETATSETTTEQTTTSEPLDSHPFGDGGSASSAFNGSSSNNYDTGSSFGTFRGRRLYRNLSDKMLGGVCSGLSKFFGGDVTVWRLGTVVMTILLFACQDTWVPDFICWFIPLAYIVMWIIVPVARTAEDMLRMSGKAVNPENINEQILNDTNSQQQRYAYDRGVQNSNNDGCLKLAGIGCLVVLLFPLITTLLSLLIATPFLTGIVSSGIFHTFPFFNGEFGGMFGAMAEGMQSVLWALIVCVIFLLLIPVFFLVRWLRGSSKPLSTVAIVSLVAVWILALIFGIFMISRSVGKMGGEMFRQLDNDVHVTYGIEDDEWDDNDDWENGSEYEEDTTVVDSIVNKLTINVTQNDDSLTLNAGPVHMGVSVKKPKIVIKANHK